MKRSYIVLNVLFAGCASSPSSAEVMAAASTPTDTATDCSLAEKTVRVLTVDEFKAWLDQVFSDEFDQQGGAYFDALNMTARLAVQMAVGQTDAKGGSMQDRTQRLSDLLNVIVQKFPNDWVMYRFDVGRNLEIPLFVGQYGPPYPMLLVQPMTGAIYGARSGLSAGMLEVLPQRPPQTFSDGIKNSREFSVEADGKGGTSLLVDFAAAYRYSKL